MSRGRVRRYYVILAPAGMEIDDAAAAVGLKPNGDDRLVLVRPFSKGEPALIDAGFWLPPGMEISSVEGSS